MSIEHVVVLCLENRSFDHMLGFLDHPDPTFEGLLQAGHTYSNPTETGESIPATATARQVLPFGPDHSHNAVLEQLGLTGQPRQLPTNSGFVRSYELTATNRGPSSLGGIIGWPYSVLMSRMRRPKTAKGRGPLIMRCQDPSRVPVLSTLAREFAVCDHWFCSVPGETWPNRNYLHAATSDGETNIQIRPYVNRTIFERLEEYGHDWRIYHDDTPQAWAFPNLYTTRERHAKWFCMDRFTEHVSEGDLPAYTFIEPNHRPVVHTLDRVEAIGAADGVSNSQHPENNLVDNDAYDSFDPGVDTDFDRGERLIATVYEALRANPKLFARTVLVITYDEHGGFYDHVPPTDPVAAPKAPSLSVGARLLRLLWRTNAKPFDFHSLGIRVPTVIVSPLIDPAVVHTPLEHASVPATLRELFAPAADPLTERDGGAATFSSVWSRTTPRHELPDLSAFFQPPAGKLADEPPPDSDRRGQVPDYYREFLKQSEQVRAQLAEVGEPEVLPLKQSTTAESGRSVTKAFVEAAARHRRPGNGV